MQPKLRKIYDFLYEYEQTYVFKQKKEQKRKGGRPKTYTDTSFLLFFMAMFLKGIFAFKKMARIIKKDYAQYGFIKPPSRKTIRERFKKLPKIIQYMLPQIACYCYRKVCFDTFTLKCLFSDKSIFRAKGGLWHKKHMKNGLIPHNSIDIDATWAKSAYHGWRFGFALLIMVNKNRFPVAAIADTATLNEPKSVKQLIQPIHQWVGIIVGDIAYKVYKIIQNIKNEFGILLQVRAKIKNKAMKWYDDLISTPQALWLYLKRKPSVEPTFALIKELFNLKGETQLPYKGLKYVIPFLLVTVLTIQIMAVYNFFNNKGLGYTIDFVDIF